MPFERGFNKEFRPGSAANIFLHNLLIDQRQRESEQRALELQRQEDERVANIFNRLLGGTTGVTDPETQRNINTLQTVTPPSGGLKGIQSGGQFQFGQRPLGRALNTEETYRLLSQVPSGLQNLYFHYKDSMKEPEVEPKEPLLIPLEPMIDDETGRKIFRFGYFDDEGKEVEDVTKRKSYLLKRTLTLGGDGGDSNGNKVSLMSLGVSKDFDKDFELLQKMKAYSDAGILGNIKLPEFGETPLDENTVKNFNKAYVTKVKNLMPEESLNYYKNELYNKEIMQNGVVLKPKNTNPSSKSYWKAVLTNYREGYFDDDPNTEQNEGLLKLQYLRELFRATYGFNPETVYGLDPDAIQ